MRALFGGIAALKFNENIGAPTRSSYASISNSKKCNMSRRQLSMKYFLRIRVTTNSFSHPGPSRGCAHGQLTRISAFFGRRLQPSVTKRLHFNNDKSLHQIRIRDDMSTHR